MERGGAHRRHVEGRVELARLDEVGEVPLVPRLVELEPHLGRLLAQALDDLGQDRRADALVDADAKRRVPLLADRGEIGLGRVHARGDRLGVAQEQVAGRGGNGVALSDAALEQSLADRALESRDLPADRRLRVAELLGRAREGALRRDGLERREMP